MSSMINDPLAKQSQKKRERRQKISCDPLLMSEADREALRAEQERRFRAVLAKDQKMKRGPGRPRKSTTLPNGS